MEDHSDIIKRKARIKSMVIRKTTLRKTRTKLMMMTATGETNKTKESTRIRKDPTEVQRTHRQLQFSLSLWFH